MWYSGLLYRLSELKFSTSLIKLIASIFTNRKLVLVEEFSTLRNIAAGVPQCTVLAPILYSLHITMTPRHMNIAFYANCNVNSWCERWNVKVNERKLKLPISAEHLESLRTCYN
jgi:hypothetical protein